MGTEVENRSLMHDAVSAGAPKNRMWDWLDHNTQQPINRSEKSRLTLPVKGLAPSGLCEL